MTRAITQRRSPVTHGHRRAGLAPLELVLALPILLLMMGLIINFGTAAAWKARAQASARYSLERSLWPRTGANDPSPGNWQSGELTTSRGGTLQSVPYLWEQQPAPNTPPIQGPVATAPGGETIQVLKRLEMADGVRHASATLERDFPLLRRGLRPFNFGPPQNAVENPWTYQQLGYPSNRYPRARGGTSRDGDEQPGWYRLEPQELASPVPQLFGDLQQALAELQSYPQATALDLLDRDEEYRAISGRQFYHDFHPRVRNWNSACTPNIEPEVQTLINDIQRLPGTLGRAFRDAYQSQVNQLQAEISALEGQMPRPPGADQQIRDLEQQMTPLQEMADRYNAYLAALPPENR